jgi:histidine ammonia-lyase
MTMEFNPEVVLQLEGLKRQLDERVATVGQGVEAVKKSRTVVERALTSGDVFYGINTGFGVLKNVRIPDEDLETLQKNLILSHSAGVGPPIPKDIARLMLGLKIHSLSLGYSGISEETLQRLVLFYQNDWIPVIPSRGSVGASGDLVPLAHMILPMLGYGSIWAADGIGQIEASELLQKNGLQPLRLKAKDGLSLINGTQFMCAYGAWVLEQSFELVRTADIVAAMSLEALQGSARPFDPRIHQIRPHFGPSETAANMRALLQGSHILEAHRNCGKVQDPYCLRCVPQVHGASRAALYHCAAVIETEMNAVTDNPLVFPDGDIVSGGNFHGQPLALALDYAALALAELASISERRTYLLLDGHDGLPRLLMKNTGINTGFMIPQYTAAALVSENKVLCHPASVDSIPTSLGQEDHVSMGSVSALKLYQIYHNVASVLAIELLTSAQALDYRMPLKPGDGVELAHQTVRTRIPHHEDDHLFYNDVQQCEKIVLSHELPRAVAAAGIHLQ